MSLTLLVESNPKIESFYTLNLSTWLGLEVVARKRADEAIKAIEKAPDQINLIITRSKIEKELTAKVLLDYLKQKNLNIPIIVIGQGKDFAQASAHVANSLEVKLLIKYAATALNITAKEMMSKEVPDYFPVHIGYFNILKRSICPVYSLNSDTLTTYDLRIEKLKDFDALTITKLMDENVEYLYVDKMDRLDFVSNITAELITMLDVEELSDDEQISAADQGLELLSRKLGAIGITDETIELAKKNIKIVRLQVKKNPKLSHLLDRLLSNKASYLYQHTQILTYVALHIVHNIDWGTPEQEDKVSFIAFFHDITLENDVQAKINNNGELKRSGLSPEDKQVVHKHAQLAAEIVVKFPHAPMGADQIIRQHHGQLNGLGFSDHYGANLSPMAIVFIVAEEFTRMLMRQQLGDSLRPEDMFRELKDVFHTNRFQKILQLLETMAFN